MHFDPQQIQELIKVGVSGVIGAVGGAVRFFYDLDKGRRKFTFVGFVSATSMAFIAGACVGEFLPEGYRTYGLTMVAGFYADYIVYKVGKRLYKQA